MTVVFALFGLLAVGLAILLYLSLELEKRMRVTSRTRYQRHYLLFNSVRRVNRVMGTKTSVQAVLDDITRACLEVFDCQQVSLMLLERKHQELVVCSAAGAFNEAVLGRKQSIGSGIAGRVAEEWKPLILGANSDFSRFSDFKDRTHPISAAMVVPILLRQDLIGVVNVTSRVSGHEYSRDDLEEAMIFAEIIAVCIRHAQQTHWMRDTIRRLSGPDRRVSGSWPLAA